MVLRMFIALYERSWFLFVGWLLSNCPHFVSGVYVYLRDFAHIGQSCRVSVLAVRRKAHLPCA